VESSLRKSLIDSHVAATAIAILFFCSFCSVSEALLSLYYPAYHAVFFLITAVAIRDIPYISHSLDPVTRMKLLIALFNILSALAYMAAAWLLSHWIFGTGPLRTLGNYRGKLTRNADA
jgi:hypothetical protein